MFAGCGCGIIMLNQITTAIVNPHNEHVNKDTLNFNDSVSLRVPRMFMGLFISFVAISMVSLLLIKDVPEPVTQADDNFTVGKPANLKVGECLKSRNFVCLYTMATCSIFQGYYAFNVYKLFG